MASTKFCKKDQNRFKKVYPFVQRKPRTVLTSDKYVEMEANEIYVDNKASITYTFEQPYTVVPTVTATVKEKSYLDNDLDAMVALSISDVTLRSVTIHASQRFTGYVFVQVMAIY